MRDPMCVAFVLGHPNPFPGAAWVRVRAHAEALVARGARVDVVGLVTPSGLTRAGIRRHDGIRLVNVVPGFSSNRGLLVAWNVATSIGAALLIWRLRPDVVILSVPPGASAVGGFLGARAAKARLVLDYRDDWESFALGQNPGGISRRVIAGLAAWMGRAYRHSDLAVAVTPPLADALRARGVPRPTVAPNGAEVSLFGSVDRTAARRGLAIEPDAIVLVYAGTVGGYYRLDVVARAMNKLANPRLMLLVVGDEAGGPLPANLNRVRNLGPRMDPRDVAQAVAAGDLGLIPYDDNPLWRSALPTKFYEYCAAGLPVIATVPRDSLLGAAVADHELGRVAPPLDADALALVIRDLAANPDLRRRLGENARAFSHGFDRRALAAQFAAEVYALAKGTVK